MNKIEIENLMTVEEWEKNNKPIPPPHIIKQKTIIEYKNKINASILVETGTYFGDMLEAMKNEFIDLYSIELSEELFYLCLDRFKENKNIHLTNGDSGKELLSIFKNIKNTTIFWLDGHYSGGITKKGNKFTPIKEELNSIFLFFKQKYIILIDDARNFGRPDRDEWPSLSEINNIIKIHNLKLKTKVKNDIIIIEP